MFEFLQALWFEFRKAQGDNEMRTTAAYLGQFNRLLKLRRHQTFSNSNMLPGMRGVCGSGEEGLSYWRDHKDGVSFDCCAMHRARKQSVLQSAADAVAHDTMPAASRALRKYHSAAQAQIMTAAGFLPVAGSEESRVRGRIFRTGDFASLHYQLGMIDQRLQDMLTRKVSAENFAPPAEQEQPVEIAAPVAAEPGEPIDIWYDLADSKATPPLMLRWLSEHGNPYIASRAGRTLRGLSKAS